MELKERQGSEDQCLLYEDIRKKNIERNEDFMHTLGLLLPRCKHVIPFSYYIYSNKQQFLQFLKFLMMLVICEALASKVCCTHFFLLSLT